MGSYLSAPQTSPKASRVDHLTRELVERVALFLPDATSFFNILQAVAVHNPTALGNLKPIFELGRSVPLHELWPALCIHTNNADIILPQLSSLLCSFCSVLAFSESLAHPQYDTLVQSVATQLQPTTDIHILDSTFVWWPSTWNMHITRLHVNGYSQHDHSDIIQALPTMAKLTRVCLVDCFQRSPDLIEGFFDCLPQSKITSLDVITTCEPVIVTRSMLRHASKWLESHRVLHFGFGQWDFRVQNDCLHPFFKALATVHDVRIDEFTLSRFIQFGYGTDVECLHLNIYNTLGINVDELVSTCYRHLTALTLQDRNKTMFYRETTWNQALHAVVVHARRLTTLELVEMFLGDADMELFAAALTTSNIQTLIFRGCVGGLAKPKPVVAFDQLGRCLPQCKSLRRLEINCRMMDPAHMESFGLGLANSPVTAFVATKITRTFLTTMAPFLGRSKLQELTLGQRDENVMTFWSSFTLFGHLLANPHLTKLTLRQIGLRNSDAYFLGRSIATHTNLRFLDLARNPLSRDTVASLIQILESRPDPACELNVTGNDERELLPCAAQGIHCVAAFGKKY
ncbi:Aste57867_2493 [Aphanomyces stellatus]|uniref:Aste57867_2493 protein n=1 Tax=Aphanomyces stellatus TaxID=120398 RepID=A0A485K953_9STRA|nr:hypothetical protein As57867_002486 [Aphanomyces stellatus]VFT79692.1 Aste57867_2493 [Aphanomyces stellatus]